MESKDIFWPIVSPSACIIFSVTFLRYHTNYILIKYPIRNKCIVFLVVELTLILPLNLD